MVVMKLNRKKKLRGSFIMEILIGVLIMGIITLLVLPNFTGVVTDVKTMEAQQQLKWVADLQQRYFYKYSKYTDNLDDLNFIQAKLTKDGGSANYQINIVASSPSSYKVQAESVVDFNQNGVMNIWEIDQTGELKEVVKD